MNFSYKQIWLIAYPILISLLMEHMINVTDTSFLGHVGEVELGASALAGVLYMAIYMLGFGFSIGAQILRVEMANRSMVKLAEYSCKVPFSCWHWPLSCFSCATISQRIFSDD